MHSENNQQIFDSCVRSLLDHCEVPLLDQPLKGLLESIEHGEGSVNTALNLIAAAHVAHLFLEVLTPIEDAKWTDALKGLKPRIESGLELCRQLLVKNLPDSAQTAYNIDLAWIYVIPREYGMEPWVELQDSGLLKCDVLGICFVRDILLFQLKQQEPTKRIELSTLAREFGDSDSRINGFVERSTAWHRFVVRDAIRAFLEDPRRIEWEEWCAVVDLCSELMRSAVPTTESTLEDIWTPTSEVHFSPTSTEYWAWEFGRVASMWPLVNKTTFDSHESEYFYDWPNGLAALSLQLGASGSDEDLFDRCWTGAAVASGFKSESGWHSAYPDQQSPSDHLFWLMRLGFLHGSRRVESSEPVLPARSVEPSDADILLLGNQEQLARVIREALRGQEPDEEKCIRDDLTEKLVGIWDRLPLDSQEHLVDAELNLKKRKWRDASLDYANAVETALSEWLPPPRDQRSHWPSALGEWVKELKGMTSQSRDRHRLDRYFRQRFDPKSASDLARALDVLREARKARAHGERRPPFANKAREAILGEGRPGIFELILKFAQRWQR